MNNDYLSFDWDRSYTHPVRPIPQPTREQNNASDILILKFIVVMALAAIGCGIWMIHRAEKAVACEVTR